MTARAELGVLEASGLIEIAALQPELEYLFRHALVQEAAYASLLKQDRRSLHRAAAETIVALHPDRQRELAGVIAMHFELAGDAPRAAEYLVIAGEHALERFATKEAGEFFKRASSLAEDLQVNVRFRAAIGRAKAGWGYGGSAEAIEELERTLGAGDQTDKRLAAEAYFWLAFLRRQRGELPETSPALKEALDRGAQVAVELNDPTVAAAPKALMASYLAFTGNLRQGAREMREALDVIESTGDSVSTAMVSDFLGMTYARLGEFAAAEEAIARSERFATGSDAIARVDLDITRSALDLERGEPEQASQKALECSRRAEGLGAYACVVASTVMFGAASLARDDASSAREPLERGNELSRVTNTAPLRTLLQGLLGSTRAQLGDMPGGIAVWDEALASARAMQDRYGEAQALWRRGQTYAEQPDADLPAALADLDHATELFEAMEARPSLARALHDRARVLRSLGRDHDAGEDDARSRRIGHELGLRDMPVA